MLSTSIEPHQNFESNIKTSESTERSRGKFKPAKDLSLDEIQSVLLNKIKEETSKIIEDELDEELIKECNNFQPKNKINVVSLFSGAG